LLIQAQNLDLGQVILGDDAFYWRLTNLACYAWSVTTQLHTVCYWHGH